MTSDAKIGLLLGLIFIFVIAFVINGLPSLRPPVSKVEATTAALPEEDFTGVTGRAEQAVSNLGDMLNQQPAGGEPAPAVAVEPKPVVQEPASVNGETPSQTQTPTANSEGVRSILTLPGMEKLLDQLTPTIRKDEVRTINVDTPGQPVEAVAGGGRQAVAAAPPARSEPVSLPEPVEKLTRVTDVRDPSRPATGPTKPMDLAGATLYTVVAGDNLATIAKKMYGLEEGNRIANIQRIFHANETLLKSPDNVVVGQKLIIPPPLPKLATTGAPAPAPATPADVLPASLFERATPGGKRPQTIAEKVKALSERAPAAPPAPTPGERLYTVQNGDNLWKIAASQLGNGSRCDEIAKLNAEILTSRDSLDVGMKLRLPPK